MTLGEVVKQYLETHKITYEAFAAQCGLTKGYVSMLVNGKNPKTGKPPVPKVETYLRIAEAMGITAKQLLEQTEKDTPTHFYIVYGPGKGQTREVSAKEFFNHHTPSNVRLKILLPRCAGICPFYRKKHGTYRHNHAPCLGSNKGQNAPPFLAGLESYRCSIFWIRRWNSWRVSLSGAWFIRSRSSSTISPWLE